MKTFLWKNTITRFGIPKAFVSNNNSRTRKYKTSIINMKSSNTSPVSYIPKAMDLLRLPTK